MCSVSLATVAILVLPRHRCIAPVSERVFDGAQTLVLRYMPQHNSTNRVGFQPSAELMAWLPGRRPALLMDVCHPLGPGARKPGERSAHSAMQPAGWPAEQVPPVSDPCAASKL